MFEKGHKKLAGSYTFPKGHKMRIVHGEKTNNSETPEHKAWSHMKERCHNPKSKDYSYYGGRGIEVCPSWRESYVVFRDYLLETIGRRPSKTHSIDRIDNNGNYEPNNIRWATKREQNLNRRQN